MDGHLHSVSGDLFVVGRSSKCDLKLEDGSVVSNDELTLDFGMSYTGVCYDCTGQSASVSATR